MDLLEIYNAVDAVLGALDFSALFDGFHRYGYALYNRAEICLDGRMMPYQEGFRGNTAIEHNGRFIAIWDMELDTGDDVEELAYLLVHEMFHCHQRAHGEKRYPSDLMLLNYPADVDNFEKKYNENIYLVEAYEKQDIGSLQKFARIRDMRMRAHPDMVRQELKVETVEGAAEYVALKALRAIDHRKFTDVIGGHIRKLRRQDGSLFDVRRISYYSGALYCLCCDSCGIALRNDFAGEETIYEQNPLAFADGPVDIRPCGFIPVRYAEIMGEREKLITECTEKWEYTACKALICGYDPMNMFRLGDFIYCKYFICLDIGGKAHNINSSIVLRLDENSGQNVVGYYLPRE